MLALNNKTVRIPSIDRYINTKTKKMPRGPDCVGLIILNIINNVTKARIEIDINILLITINNYTLTDEIIHPFYVRNVE